MTDIIYLTLNLGQECGLQDWLEDAFLVKHSDNMRKQHDSVTHLSWTRAAHARACKCTEESLNFTVSRTNTGKWLLYSNGKLIKPYDYVPSDYSQLLNQTRKGELEAGSDHPERASRVGHTSGHDSSQFTFANVGIQVSLCDNTPKGDTDRLGQHGWQSALMTSMMWLSNVVGEYLTKLSQPPEVAPITLPRLIDDPVTTLEQTVMDLRIAQEAKETSGVLKHIGLLMYYSMMMATTTGLCLGGVLESFALGGVFRGVFRNPLKMQPFCKKAAGALQPRRPWGCRIWSTYIYIHITHIHAYNLIGWTTLTLFQGKKQRER